MHIQKETFLYCTLSVEYVKPRFESKLKCKIGAESIETQMISEIMQLKMGQLTKTVQMIMGQRVALCIVSLFVIIVVTVPLSRSANQDGMAKLPGRHASSLPCALRHAIRN
jgi:hypothetical protein